MSYNEDEGAPPAYAAIEITEGQQSPRQPISMNEQYAVFPVENEGVGGPIIVAANAIIPDREEEQQNIREQELLEMHQRYDNALCLRCGTLNAKRGLRIGFCWLALIFLVSVIRHVFNVNITYKYESTEKDEDGTFESDDDDTGVEYSSFRILRLLQMIGPICCIVTAMVGALGLKWKNKKKLIFAQKGLSLLFFFTILDVVTSLIARTNMFSTFLNVFNMMIFIRMMQTNKQMIVILNSLNN